MAGALLGYLFYAATAFAVTTVLLIGLVDDTKLGNTRHHPQPIIARTIAAKSVAHRHQPATSGTKQASTAKDTDTLAASSLQEAPVDELRGERLVRLHGLKVVNAPD